MFGIVIKEIMINKYYGFFFQKSDNILGFMFGNVIKWVN